MSPRVRKNAMVKKNSQKDKEKSKDWFTYMHALLTIESPRLYLLGSHILLGTVIGEPVLQITTKYNASLSIMNSKLSYENKAFAKTIINDHWNVSIINMTKQIFVWFCPCYIWWIWWWLTFFLSFLHRWNSWASTK